jgi:cytochrome o ubiquinol oxidase subunit I
MVWYIWWLAIISIIAVISVIITLSVNDDDEYVIRADEVERIESERLKIAIKHQEQNKLKKGNE